MRAAVLRALDEVKTAVQVTRMDMFTVLGASVNARRFQVGRRVLYGAKV